MARLHASNTEAPPLNVLNMDIASADEANLTSLRIVQALYGAVFQVAYNEAHRIT